jgi:hypothetical protein
MRWTGCEAGMGEMRNAYNIFIRKPEMRRPLGTLGIDGRII